MPKEQIVISLSRAHKTKLYRKIAGALTGENPECLRPGTVARQIIEDVLDMEFPDASDTNEEEVIR